MLAIAARFGLGEPAWLNPAIVAGSVLVAALTAFLFHLVFIPLALKLTHRTSTDLDDQIVRAARWPLNMGIIVLGFYLALSIPLDLTQRQQEIVDTVARAAGLLVGTSLVLRVVSSLLDWYLKNLAVQTPGDLDDRLVPMVRRVVIILIAGIGGLLVLDTLGVPISPLIAGLGLGGLAVALAIQPTLSNLFAGAYVITEGVITPGDYIELEGSVAGYVVEVSWRSTRVRTWENNLVVIPNAKFAETIFTNYQQPTPPVNVYLTCGVSYESDLDRVEAVSREVMGDLLETDPNGVREYGGWFGFESFGDSNVIFWLFLQAKDRLASFELQSALIRDLQRRFSEEGIVINYPVRALRLPESWRPDGIGQQDRSEAVGTSGARRPSPRRTPTGPPADGPSLDDAPPSSAGDGPEA